MSELAPHTSGARGEPRDARTVPIFRKPCHVLEAIKFPSQYFLDRLYEAVRRPACELVERHELISLRKCMGL
jgi:hypothetical protein